MSQHMIAFLVAAALLAPVHVFAESTLMDRFSDAELIEIMNDEGYSAVSKVEDGVIQIKIEGTAYLVLNLGDGDLQAFYGISGAEMSCEDINEWNRTKRLSRAYLDSDRDPVLESDLLANGGLTKRHVAEFFKVFVTSAGSFRDFVIARSQS